jgi:hypothetical protein
VPAPLRLTATLQPRGPAAAIVLSDEHVATLADGQKTPAVTVTVDDRYTFQGRVGRMGGENLVGFNKAVRTAAGVSAGDTIDVVIVADTTERQVEVPADLAEALERADASAAFAALAPSHRKEYVRWITEAKRPETRAKRITEGVVMISEGRARR